MQRRVNDAVWAGDRRVAAYASRVLRPVEVVILARYRDGLTGRTLEIGAGAGRLTGYLAELATSTHGIDVSAAMVAVSRGRYPRATFAVADLRDAAAYRGAPYDAIVAPFNVLDVVDDDDRRVALGRIHGALRPGGLLVMSSHNRAAGDRRADPLRLARGSLREMVASIVRLPRRRRNHRRLSAYERNEPSYAILNDVEHDYSVLHYYIHRDAQVAQLEEHGFEVLDVLDLEGHSVGPGDSSDDPELHYVARRREPAGG
jgi:SAM-dependent methyltransferase